MVDKVGGHGEYAVMAYGGFLRMGERYFPLPWQTLDYVTRRGGYRIDMTARDLERAPSFDRNSEPSFNRRYGSRVYKIGRAHVCTPVTNEHLVLSLLLENNNIYQIEKLQNTFLN